MGKWQRYQYLPLQPLGDDGRMVTGSREHIALSRKAATEGMVLLKNENKALPLVPGEKVALFGKACAYHLTFGAGDHNFLVNAVYLAVHVGSDLGRVGKAKFKFFRLTEIGIASNFSFNSVV